MPSPMFPTLPSGLDFRVFPVPEGHDPGIIGTPMDSPHQVRRGKWTAPLRDFMLKGENLSWLDLETVAGWGRDTLVNWRSYFYITNVAPLYRPGAAPSLSSTPGGALSQTTYYVTYTWSDNVSETTESAEANLLVAANHFLVVTLPALFPTAVGRGKLYIGTSSGAEKYEDVITTEKGSWTQSGALVGTLDPPATNEFYEVVPVFLKPGTIITPVKSGPQTWDLDLPLVEHRV